MVVKQDRYALVLQVSSAAVFGMPCTMVCCDGTDLVGLFWVLLAGLLALAPKPGRSVVGQSSPVGVDWYKDISKRSVVQLSTVVTVTDAKQPGRLLWSELEEPPEVAMKPRGDQPKLIRVARPE